MPQSHRGSDCLATKSCTQAHWYQRWLLLTIRLLPRSAGSDLSPGLLTMPVARGGAAVNPAGATAPAAEWQGATEQQLRQMERAWDEYKVAQDLIKFRFDVEFGRKQVPWSCCGPC